MDYNDPLTVESSFAKRLFKEVHEPSAEILSKFESFVHDWIIEQNVPKINSENLLSHEDWLDNNKSFDEKKKDAYRRAYESLAGNPPSNKMRHTGMAHGKREHYDDYKNLRNIIARPMPYRSYIGPWYKSMEDIIFKMDWFIKHTPVPERSQKIYELNVTGNNIYNTDYSGFEGSLIPQIMWACEVQLYNHMLSDYPQIARMIESDLLSYNTIISKTGVKAGLHGRRLSGEMCTSLGNSFTNLMVLLFLIKHHGGDYHDVRGYVEGDDGIFTSPIVLKSEFYEELGFEIKLLEYDDACKASFCGLIFASSGQIIRDPRRFFNVFSWTQSFIHAGDKIMLSLLRAKALSSIYETPHCPIVGVMTREALKYTHGYKAKFINDGYHDQLEESDIKIESFNPSSETRMLFQEIYGIDINTQLIVEQLIREHKMDQVAMLLPSSDHMVEFSTNYVTIM